MAPMVQPGTAARPGGARTRWHPTVAALVVGAVALCGLTVGAVHGGRSTAANSTERQAASWQLDAAYWRCLDAQARSVIAPNEPIWIDRSDLVSFVALEKVLGPWADIASRRDEGRVVVTLSSRTGRGTCLGSQVVTRARLPGGGTVVRHGTGASLPGSARQLPSTPL